MPEASRHHSSPVGAARLRRQRRRQQQLRATAGPADAAARSTPDGPVAKPDTADPAGVKGATPPTPRRILRDLLRPTRSQAVIAVILCLCTMGAIWQVRGAGTDQAYSQMTRTELVGLLDQVNTSNGQLRSEIGQLQTQKTELQSGANSSRVAQQQARQRLDELAILAGTAPAEGSGITITITDNQGKVGHELLVDAVEEMRDAGAEAIDINGVRVVASSWFGANNQGLVIDNTPISPPFVMTIIGESQTLEQGARFRGGLVSQAEAPQVGAVVTIVGSQRLSITSLHTAKAPQFARPA